MGAKYDGIHWDPPAGEQHKWRHGRPSRPASLRVYEAHVGMSSEQGCVATYTYFKGGCRRCLGLAGVTGGAGMWQPCHMP
jgi:hypothetical protein